jgi:hypothetical protein
MKNLKEEILEYVRKHKPGCLKVVPEFLLKESSSYGSYFDEELDEGYASGCYLAFYLAKHAGFKLSNYLHNRIVLGKETYSQKQYIVAYKERFMKK